MVTPLAGVRGGTGTAVAVWGAGSEAAGFFELWYICVSRSSARLLASMAIRTRRFLKKAWKKMAGTDMPMPSSVITRPCEMSSASFCGLMTVELRKVMKLSIMLYTVPTRPSSGPRVPMVAR